VRSSSSTVVPSGIHFAKRGGSSQSSSFSASADPTSTTQHQIISEENLGLLSERGRDAVRRLIESDPWGHQRHIYGEWPETGVEDEGKKRLGDQVGHEITCDGYEVRYVSPSHCFGGSWLT
jgi:hypothetical protein